MDPLPSARVIELDSIDSTNTEAIRRARQGERGPLWVVAREQTGGRGRLGRHWVSERGNLYATLLLINPAPPEDAAELSFVAALALADAVLRLAPELSSRVSLKWPNDVLLDGHKVAGILIEAETGEAGLITAIGMGVNCAHHPAGTRLPATDLAAQDVNLTSARLFEALSATFARRLAQWARGVDFASIRRDWLNLAAGIGSEVVVRLDGAEVRGCFETLDAAGRLMLRLPDGRSQSIAAGDVITLGSVAVSATMHGRRP